MKLKNNKVSMIGQVEPDGRKYGNDGKVIIERKPISKWWYIIALILESVLCSIITLAIANWFRSNTIVFYNPIKIQLHKPISFVNRETYKQEQEMALQTAEIKRKAIEQYENPTLLPKCSAEVMERIDPQKFWDIVWESESTKGKALKGKHIACRNKGLFNEIGYSPSTNFCFHSKEEAQLFIPYYVSKNCNGKTLNECLCFWNLGKWVNECPYSNGNLSQAN